MHLLIIKMSSLGDIIQAFTVLPYFKQYHPHCRIDWVVEMPFADLVRAHPFVHRTILVQTKKWRLQCWRRQTWQEIAEFQRELRRINYDFTLDLQGNIKSGIVTALAKASLKVGFSYPFVAEWPNLLATNKKYCPPSNQNIRDDYLFLAKSIMGNFIHQKEGLIGVQLNLSIEEKIQLQPILEEIKQYKGLKVLICPGSNWINKQLSKETLRDFLICFSKKIEAHFLFIWGNLSEKKLSQEVAIHLSKNSSIIHRLSLPLLQNLMAQVDLILAMDSLPLHLAGLTLTPTYSIFGASSAHKYKPIGEQHAAFQGVCPYGKIFEKRCDILRTCPTGDCIKRLEGQQLFAHFHKWWLSLKKSCC